MSNYTQSAIKFAIYVESGSILEQDDEEIYLKYGFNDEFDLIKYHFDNKPEFENLGISFSESTGLGAQLNLIFEFYGDLKNFEEAHNSTIKALEGLDEKENVYNVDNIDFFNYMLDVTERHCIHFKEDDSDQSVYNAYKNILKTETYTLVNKDGNTIDFKNYSEFMANNGNTYDIGNIYTQMDSELTDIGIIKMLAKELAISNKLKYSEVLKVLRKLYIIEY